MLSEVTNLQQYQPTGGAKGASTASTRKQQPPQRQPSLFKLGLATLPTGSQLSERVVRMGSLNKLSTSSTLKRWQNRKFALTTNGDLDGCLLKYCYPEEAWASNMLNIRGAIELSKCTSVEAAGSSIKFEMENSNSLKLKAASSAKAGAWVGDIKRVFEFYQERGWSGDREAQDQRDADRKKTAFDLKFHERRAGLLGVEHIALLPFSPRHQAKNSASIFTAPSAPSFSSHVLQARSTSLDVLWQKLHTCRPTLRQHSAQALALAKHGFFPNAPTSAKVFVQGFKNHQGTANAKQARAFEKRHSRTVQQPNDLWNHTRLVSRWFGSTSTSTTNRRR